MRPVFDDAAGGTDVVRGMWDGCLGWKSSAEGRERDAKPPKTGAERSGGLFFLFRQSGWLGKGKMECKEGEGGRGWVRNEVCFAFGLSHEYTDLKMWVLVNDVDDG